MTPSCANVSGVAACWRFGGPGASAASAAAVARAEPALTTWTVVCGRLTPSKLLRAYGRHSNGSMGRAGPKNCAGATLPRLRMVGGTARPKARMAIFTGQQPALTSTSYPVARTHAPQPVSLSDVVWRSRSRHVDCVVIKMSSFASQVLLTTGACPLSLLVGTWPSPKAIAPHAPARDLAAPAPL